MDSPTEPSFSGASTVQLRNSEKATLAIAGLQVPSLSSLATAVGTPGVTAEQCAHPLTIVHNNDRRSPPFASSRRRPRSGTFVRITTVPVPVFDAVGPCDSAGHHSKMEARAEARCLRLSLRHDPNGGLRRDTRNGLRQQDVPPAAVATRPRPRMVAAKETESGRPRGADRGDATTRQAELAAPRVSKSGGAGRNRELRRNRWRSPFDSCYRIEHDRGTRSKTSLLSASWSGRSREGGGGPGEALSRTTSSADWQNSSLVRVLRHCCRPTATAGARETCDGSSFDGGSSGTAYTGHERRERGRGAVGEGGARKKGMHEVSDLTLETFSTDFLPQVSRQHKRCVHDSGPRGRTELSAAAASVTAAAASVTAAALTAVAAAVAAADRSQREALFWRDCSNSLHNRWDNGDSKVVATDHDADDIGIGRDVSDGGFEHSTGAPIEPPSPTIPTGEKTPMSARSPRELLYIGQ